ncbi:MAG: glutamine synthetase, partial [Pseudomonadota bacterium]|nr:glutamine synthetase [Pseudomonadota bacterium]
MKPRLRAMFCDHLSIMRGKYLPGSKIGDDGTRFCLSVFGTHYDRDLLDAPGARVKQGLPDMELIWRGDEIRPGWERSTQVVLGDLHDDTGAPLPLYPRGALKRAVAD